MQKVVREEWMRACLAAALAGLVLAIGLTAGVGAHEEEDIPNHVESGRHLFERESFGGNGRTCVTCHSRRTGTVSPEDAQERFARDPDDPLSMVDEALVAGTIANTNGLLVILAKMVAKGVFDRDDLKAFSDSYSKPLDHVGMRENELVGQMQDQMESTLAELMRYLSERDD